MLGLFPGAGGNWQEIMTRFWSPNISVNFAGDAGIEREVNEELASYGRQIGWLNDVVLALGANAQFASGSDGGGWIREMKTAQERIEKIKNRRKESALERDALNTLADEDASAYRDLLRSSQRVLPASSA
jgi:hypothetical protein